MIDDVTQLGFASYAGAGPIFNHPLHIRTTAINRARATTVNSCCTMLDRPKAAGCVMRGGRRVRPAYLQLLLKVPFTLSRTITGEWQEAELAKGADTSPNCAETRIEI